MMLSPFLFAGSFAGFLNLVREKKPDILHAHWILPNGFIAGAVSRITGIPLIIQLHGSDVFTAEKNPLFRQMAKFAGKSASYIISPSPDLRERLGRIGLDTGKIGIVPNCVEKDFGGEITPEITSDTRKKLGIEPSKKVILALGRMVYVKGFDYLLRAFRSIAEKYTDTVLILAGDGVLYNDMKRLAGELGIAGQSYNARCIEP